VIHGLNTLFRASIRCLLPDLLVPTRSMPGLVHNFRESSCGTVRLGADEREDRKHNNEVLRSQIDFLDAWYSESLQALAGDEHII
jgi:hypothetical protein